jgi:hypothetical protein
VKEEDNVDEIPSLVTTTSFAPAVPIGVVQRIWLPPLRLGETQTFPSIVTAYVPEKFDPYIVKSVPPAVVPLVGEIEEIA